MLWCELKLACFGAFIKLDEGRRNRAKLVPWLRLTLQSTPYWARGHLLFAKASLELHNIADAYAGAVCVAQCATSSAELKREAQLVLASCFLQSGAPQKTIETLERLRAEDTLPVLALEDLAAAYMATNAIDQAREILSGIEKSLLSASGNAALEYLGVNKDK